MVSTVSAKRSAYASAGIRTQSDENRNSQRNMNTSETAGIGVGVGMLSNLAYLGRIARITPTSGPDAKSADSVPGFDYFIFVAWF